MCEAQRPVSSAPLEEANMLLCESDRRFFRCLFEFTAQEKEKLRCPEEGPDQLRYTVFSKVTRRVRIRADNITEVDPAQ